VSRGLHKGKISVATAHKMIGADRLIAILSWRGDMRGSRSSGMRPHVADAAELPRQVHFHLEVLCGLFLDVEDLRVAVACT